MILCLHTITTLSDQEQGVHYVVVGDHDQHEEYHQLVS